MTASFALHHREFFHLVLGKAVSAALGLGVLALLWRAVSPTAYGEYLALLALMEILVLVSALGLSTLTQRHLPVWVAHAAGPLDAIRYVAAVLTLRAALAAAAAAMVLFLAGSWMPGLVARIGPFWWLGWVVSGTLMRSLEEVQSALLMQAWVQGLLVMAHGVRLSALIFLPPEVVLGDHGVGSHAVETVPSEEWRWLLGLEVTVAAVVVLVGLGAVAARLRRRSQSQDPMSLEMPLAWPLAWRACLGFWGIQCLGLAWSLHTLRLIAQALAGPSVLAVHSAAQALADALRQASPLVWMSGWLRATMLRLQAQQPDGGSAWHLVRGVERASAVLMWPALASWCVEPSAWLRWVAGPSLVAEAQRLSLSQPALPPYTALLATAALLVPLQNHHLCLALWTQVRQRWGWGMCGALAAVLWPAALPLMWPVLGLWSIPMVMVAAEWTWIGVVRWGWRATRQAGDGQVDPDGRQGAKPPPEPATSFLALAVPLTALVAASLASLALGVIWPHDETDLAERWPSLQALWPMVVATASVVVLLRVCPAWSRLERRVVLRCMPPRLTLAWRRVSQGVHP